MAKKHLKIQITCFTFFHRRTYSVSVRNPKKTYLNSKVFKIIPKHHVQLGDIYNHDGSGQCSYFEDDRPVKDEISKNLTFCEAGVVAIANRGPNTGGSQIFITFDDLPYLNTKYTIVGQVIKGYETLKSLTALCGSLDEINTKCDVRVSKTGIYNYHDYTNVNKLKL